MHLNEVLSDKLGVRPISLLPQTRCVTAPTPKDTLCVQRLLQNDRIWCPGNENRLNCLTSPYEWYSSYQTQQSLRENNRQLKSVLSVLTSADLHGDTLPLRAWTMEISLQGLERGEQVTMMGSKTCLRLGSLFLWWLYSLSTCWGKLNTAKWKMNPVCFQTLSWP